MAKVAGEDVTDTVQSVYWAVQVKFPSKEAPVTVKVRVLVTRSPSIVLVGGGREATGPTQVTYTELFSLARTTHEKVAMVSTGTEVLTGSVSIKGAGKGKEKSWSPYPCGNRSIKYYIVKEQLLHCVISLTTLCQ